MTSKELETGLARLDRQFMRPQIDGPVAVWVVDTDQGTEIVPIDVCDDREGLTQYLQGEPYDLQDAERRSGQYIARLSAPGFMDCTDWSIFDSYQAAAEYLVETYDDQDDDDREEA